MTVCGHIQAGIERIIINGSVRLMWKPLLGELPIIGGMQASSYNQILAEYSSSLQD